MLELIALAFETSLEVLQIIRDSKDDPEACRRRVQARYGQAAADVAGLDLVQEKRWAALENSDEEPTKP